MTEMKAKIMALQAKVVQAVNTSGLPLEVSELALRYVLSELSGQVNAMQPTPPKQEEEKKKETKKEERKGESDEVRHDHPDGPAA